MTESPQNSARNLEIQEPLPPRREWELIERIAELEGDLAERVELDRVHELELTSLRHELELRVAYNASLEQKIDEYSQEITWLRGEVEFLRLRLTESTSARSTRLSRRAVRASVALIRRSRLLTSLLRRLRSLVRESM